MIAELTFWVTPFTGLTSLDEAIGAANQAASSLSAVHPNLLLPTHFGPWPQSECRQTLPPDMLVVSPDDVAPIRQKVEAAGLGFGCWGVPVDGRSPELAANFARAGGYYSANFEPAEFWTPGDDPAVVDDWWQRFWDTLGADADALSGNVSATVVPNQWGIGAFRNSLVNLAAGCGALALEVYGGLQTAQSYPAPNLWPTDGFAQVRATGVQANLIPIVARANLASQMTQARRLGHGQVQVWAI